MIGQVPNYDFIFGIIIIDDLTNGIKCAAKSVNMDIKTLVKHNQISILKCVHFPSL